MPYPATDITWLIETPAGKAGFSVRDGLCFLHYTANPDDFRAPLEVRSKSQYFFDMVRNRGFDVAYSIVPASDKKLNRFQTLAGMDFISERNGYNLYRVLL